MSSEKISPPPDEQQGTNTPVAEQGTLPGERPALKFSATRWATTGVIRLLYRGWTRVAAHLFPEDSVGERIATALHLPLPDRLNLSWVTDRLAVGGRVLPEDIHLLARIGITNVIDTRAEHCDDEQAMAKEQVKLLYLPAPDTYPLSVEQLQQGAAWANESIKQGGRVLIHCEHGVGRSVLLTCATLVYDGMHASDALKLVMEKRWQAAPNHRQVARLREFEATLTGKRDSI